MSLHMDPKQQKILDDLIVENNDDHIRRKLIEKYNAYYRHWQDLNWLVAIFACIALFLSIYQWESEFSSRGADGRQMPEDEGETDAIVLVVSIMGAIAIVMKWYFQTVW